MTVLDWGVILVFLIGFWFNGKVLRRIARNGVKSAAQARWMRGVDYVFIIFNTDIALTELTDRDYVVAGAAIGILIMCCVEVFLVNRWLDRQAT